MEFSLGAWLDPMTTIAWDGTTLAGDRLLTNPHGAMAMTKIRRTPDGRLIGAAGCAPFTVRFLDWLEQPVPRGQVPEFQASEQDCVAALEILPDCTVFLHERGGSFPANAAHLAVGSGAAFARGAMASGKTAAEAVAIAAALDSCTGGEVDAIIFPTAEEVRLCEALKIEPAEYIHQREVAERLCRDRPDIKTMAVEDMAAWARFRANASQTLPVTPDVYHGLARGE